MLRNATPRRFPSAKTRREYAPQFKGQLSPHQAWLAIKQSHSLPSGRAVACSTFQGRQDYPCTKPHTRWQVISTPRPPRPDGGEARRPPIGGRAQNWRLIPCVFLPFVAAYYLSFLFRTINATVAGALTAEFGLGAGDLGLLTSVYYLTFAAAQIPIGILLD